MSIIKRIKGDLVIAMKSGETEIRDILRFVQSKANAIAKEDMKRPIEERASANETDMLLAIQRQIKQNHDVIEIYKKENKDFSKEEFEISVLISYLPDQKTENEMREIIESIVSGVEKSPKSKGLVMKELSKYKDEMNMKRAGEIVSEMLASS